MNEKGNSFANSPEDEKRLRQAYGGWPPPNSSSWKITGWETPA